MSLVNRNKVNMGSIVIHASRQRMEKTGERRKYQNYPNLGVGARGASNRNRIYSKTVCPTYDFPIPKSPTGVTLVSSDSTNMTLLITANDRFIFSYLVVLTPIGAGDTIKKVTTSNTVTIDNLDSDKFYNINVKSYNPAGYSTPLSSDYSVSYPYTGLFTTPYYTKVAAPENLSVVEATTDSLTIQFTPALLSNVSSYTIKYGTTTISNISETDLTDVNEDDDYYRYTITGLTSGTLYTISLYASNNKGLSSAVTVTEDTLTEPIKTLDLTSISNSSIGVSYTAPDSADTIDMYRITYGVYGSSTTETVDVSNNVTSCILSELDSNTEYQVSVVTNNKNGDDAGHSTELTATKYTLPDSPTSITIANVAASIADIIFTEPTRNTNLSYTLVYYPTDTTTYDVSTYKGTISSFTSGNTISELVYPVNYTVELKSVNSVAGTTSSIIDSSFTTLDYTPTIPRNLTATNQDTTSITISFDSPLKGSVSYFNIYWVTTAGSVSASWNSNNWKVGSSAIELNLDTLDPTLQTSPYSYTISGLDSNIAHYIRVTAVNDDGESDYATFYSSANSETSVKTKAAVVKSADIYVPKNFNERLSQSVTL